MNMHRQPNAATFPDRQWLGQIFSAAAAGRGGIVRRSIRDVESRVGRRILELEVRRRGYHLIECGGQVVIFCDRGEIRLIC